MALSVSATVPRVMLTFIDAADSAPKAKSRHRAFVPESADPQVVWDKYAKERARFRNAPMVARSVRTVRRVGVDVFVEVTRSGDDAPSLFPHGSLAMLMWGRSGGALKEWEHLLGHDGKGMYYTGTGEQFKQLYNRVLDLFANKRDDKSYRLYIYLLRCVGVKCLRDSSGDVSANDVERHCLKLVRDNDIDL